MNKISPKAKGWTAAALVVAIGAGFVYFRFLPSQRRIRLIQHELATIATSADHAVQIVAESEATTAALVEAAGCHDRWHRNTPSEEELPQLFGKMEELATICEVETTRFEPQRAVPHETVIRIAVEAEYLGDFAQIARLLTGLESRPETIWIERLEIQANSDDSEVCRAELSLVIFAVNPEDSDQENKYRKPIHQEGVAVVSR